MIFLDQILHQGKLLNLVISAKDSLESIGLTRSFSTSKTCIQQCLASIGLSMALLLVCGNANGTTTDSLFLNEDNRVKSSKNLSYELELLEQHNLIADNYNNNYNSLKQVKQPANKIEKCDLSSDLLDPILTSNSMVFWEGSCKNDQADGFGRVYIISSGRKVFEMLANFNSDNNDLTTAYYTKNTKIDSRTIYFYGKTNRFQSSGILITQSRVDNDLLVGMQTVDKVRLITFQKETSRNSKYVLNIKDYGNFVHFIHDLIHTPYRSLTMSYRLTNRATNNNYGYNFTGHTDGSIAGHYVDQNNNSTQTNIPVDVIDHVMDINREIDINVEGALKNVIESIPVVDAYKNVVCNENYQNPTCTKMRCKEICDLNTEITPENNGVKELLLRLVEHHNNKPLVAYLETAKNNQENDDNNIESPSSSFSNLSEDNTQTNKPKSLSTHGSSSYGTIEKAYDFSSSKNGPPANALDSLNNSNQAGSNSPIKQGGFSFGNQVNVDSAIREQLYEAKGPSLSHDYYNQEALQTKERIDRQRKESLDLSPNNLSKADPLSDSKSIQAQKELQEKINKEKAIRDAQEAEAKRMQEERRQEILESQRRSDRFNAPSPVIDYSQIEEEPY